MDVLYIKILDEFDIDLCVTFLNCTGSDVLLIRISTKSDLDLCVTFINFQADSISEDLVNATTFRRLPVSSCNFTWMFST